MVEQDAVPAAGWASKQAVGVLAVIPARYASSRFPGKALFLIDGVPMVVRVLRNVQRADLVDQVIVATDDERIAATVREAGGEAVLTSADLPSGSDRVWAVASSVPAEILVNVQGDEPLLPPTVVDALVERLLSDERYDVATPVVRTSRFAAVSSDVVTVAREGDGSALYFSRSVIPSGSEEVWGHIGVYAYRRAALERYVAAPPALLEQTERLEQLRALALGLRIAAVEVDAPRQAVDRPSDVAAVERLLRTRDAPKGRAVRLVALDVDGVLTDGRISYVADRDQVMSFDVKDGYGVVALLEAGVGVAVISSRDSPALRHRASELGITTLRVGVPDKAAALTALSTELGVPLSEICYLGDDDPDVPAMRIAGLAAAPSDATPGARAHAGIVLSRRGGRGAVRELADLLLATVIDGRRR
jgi:3-deoxy-D-manno-octulosonate 8-phosphate phosphatase (KDO 8-P phosphatase)